MVDKPTTKEAAEVEENTSPGNEETKETEEMNEADVQAESAAEHGPKAANQGVDEAKKGEKHEEATQVPPYPAQAPPPHGYPYYAPYPPPSYGYYGPPPPPPSWAPREGDTARPPPPHYAYAPNQPPPPPPGYYPYPPPYAYPPPPYYGGPPPPTDPNLLQQPLMSPERSPFRPTPGSAVIGTASPWPIVTGASPETDQPPKDATEITKRDFNLTERPSQDMEEDNDDEDAQEEDGPPVRIRNYVRAPSSSDPRRVHKNQRARARAEKERQRVEVIMVKPEDERTEEEQALLDKFEERRASKNNRSRERAIERKEMLDKILSKADKKRTKAERQFLVEHLSRKKRKNEGDRLRRNRLKMLGLKSREGGIKVTARGPLPPGVAIAHEHYPPPPLYPPHPMGYWDAGGYPPMGYPTAHHPMATPAKLAENSVKPKSSPPEHTESV